MNYSCGRPPVGGVARRRRERRLRSWWRHEQQTVRMALVAAAHHSAQQNGAHGDRRPPPGPGRVKCARRTTLHGARTHLTRVRGQASLRRLGRRGATAAPQGVPSLADASAEALKEEENEERRKVEEKQKEEEHEERMKALSVRICHSPPLSEAEWVASLQWSDQTLGLSSSSPAGRRRRKKKLPKVGRRLLPQRGAWLDSGSMCMRSCSRS